MSQPGSAAFRLSVMMFLQYAVWGAWLPTAATYLTKALGFTGAQMGLILGTAGSIGAVAAPFIAGQVADRWFNTERCLAVLLVAGAAFNWVLATQTSFESWLVLSIAYSVVFMPTLALSNSLALANLPDPQRQFPIVRVFGTIGWIAASAAFPWIWNVQDAPQRLVESFRFSAWIALAYALWCLVALPATPPRREGVEPLAFAKALRMLGIPAFAVLVAVSLPISVIHNIYFLNASNFLISLGLKTGETGPAMAIGQVSELVVMMGLGWMLKGLGFRAVIGMGALAYAVRYLIWSQTSLPVALLVGSQVLHGVCYACFFAASYIYVDRVAPPDVRHSAQTVFGILILGGGPILGGWLSGRLSEAFQGPEGLDYSRLWLTVSLIGLGAAIAFVALFRNQWGEVGSTVSREPR
jgi:nucleoside transporter